jgi:integrase
MTNNEMQHINIPSADLVESNGVFKRRQRDYMDVETYYKFLNTVPDGKHKVMFQFLWMSGSRISEAILVRKRDINFQTNEVMLRWLKSRKWYNRVIPIKKELSMMLSVYTMSMLADDYLFPFSRFQAFRYCKKYFFLSPHKFRHSFAINFIRQTGDWNTLRILLGHNSLKTTMIYANLAPIDQAKVLSEVKM